MSSDIIKSLSFSRIKALLHSPLALKAYLDKKKEPTKAMNEGSLLDILLFTPELFDAKFVVMPEGLRKPSVTQINAKEPSSETVKQVEKWKEFEQAIAGRCVVSQKQYDHAKFLEQCVRNNTTVVSHGLLHPDNWEFQANIEFKYMGFLHRGKADAKGVDRNAVPTIWDLKKMSSKSGSQPVRSQIRANKYDLQAAIYCHEYDMRDEHINYYIIAVSDDGYVTPFRISADDRRKARFEWIMAIKGAHRCNLDESLDTGTEFWADSSGFFNY